MYSANMLSENFCKRDAVTLARELLGKVLCTVKDGILTSGIISETEAYMGVIDRASHAYGGRRTSRTEVMYGCGGCAYVYLIYGMYYCMNVVANVRDVPEAVLIRAFIPKDGIETMRERRAERGSSSAFRIPDAKLADGPGKLCVALGITKEHNGLSLCGDKIFIRDDGYVPDKKIVTGKRVNIDYAGEDVEKPWRFMLDSSDRLRGCYPVK